MTQLVHDVQAALRAARFDPGLLDGDWGPNTRKAMQAWEISKRLPLTDTITDTVIVNLLGRTAPPPIGWLDEATRLKGLREGPGKADNPIILEWADDLDLHYPHDDIAWCGLFVAHCIRTALPDEPLPANPLGARQWEKLGVSVPPQLGAIGTFWRGSPKTGLGHVGLLVAARADAYLVRGGNTHDDVSDAWLSKERFTGARWPATGPKPFGRALPWGGAGALSVNEA